MKVIIVGAGLSGLTTAIALKKYVQSALKEPLEIVVYDPPNIETATVTNDKFFGRSSPRSKDQGAAISLQPNGLKVLRGLEPRLADKVKACGFPSQGFTWKTAGDWLLGKEYLDVLPISRPVLIECLQEFLPDGVVVRWSQEEADLVVGADGIGSPVRKGLFGEDEAFRPNYLGHCAVGDVLELEEPLSQDYLSNPFIVFIQSAVGVFGYCGLSQADPKRVLYFSFYDSDLPQKGEKPDHRQIKNALVKRHKGWADPSLRDA